MKAARKIEGKLEIRCMAIRIITVRNWTKLNRCGRHGDSGCVGERGRDQTGTSLKHDGGLKETRKPGILISVLTLKV